jgi:transcriptional regulator with GAF, ATPase, and Fis domain
MREGPGDTTLSLVSEDPILRSLTELGADAGSDAVASACDLVRANPKNAGRLVDLLLPALALTEGQDAARVAIVAGHAYLARGEHARARELLLQGLELAPKEGSLAARGALALARSELALGNAAAARAGVNRALAGILEQEDLLDDLTSLLSALREDLAAAVVSRLRRERNGGTGRDRADVHLDVVSRLARALNSGAGATSEPLYEVLRAVLAETGAERGFVLLYEGSTLRFELGLGRDGRTLVASDFAFSSTVVERALETGQCVLVPRLATTLPFAQASSARDLELGAALCAPLRAGRKRPGASRGVVLTSVRGMAGVLYVDARTEGSFGERDARFFEILADCTVVALRAARANEALEKAAAEAVARAPQRSFPAKAPEGPQESGGLVTRDPAMRNLLRTIDKVAPAGTNVLVRGESGTGKELVARTLHARGPGAKGPFVVVDCGAIPDELVAAELFGHEENAFTSAGPARAGLLERADGGTLFLDEVGEMSPAMQGSLLRAVQEGEVRRLGAGAARVISVRLVAATHRDLRAMVERNEFRQDLLYRLAGLELRIPPLRERPGDVPLLVEYFLARIGAERGAPVAIDPAALERLEEHGWPGNVRELENVLRGASVFASDTIGTAEIEDALGQARVKPAARPAAGPVTTTDGPLEDLEKRAIEERLDRFGWNQVQAAKSLGLDRNTLRRKILRYGIVRRG